MWMHIAACLERLSHLKPGIMWRGRMFIMCMQGNSESCQFERGKHMLKRETLKLNLRCSRCDVHTTSTHAHGLLLPPPCSFTASPNPHPTSRAQKR